MQFCFCFPSNAGNNMQQKNPPAAEKPDRQDTQLSPADPSAGNGGEVTARIDFLSPEFNVTDDLDDNIGNYREFQSLEGIVTADMRYHEKRKRRSEPEAVHSDTIPEKPSDEAIEGNRENNESVQPLTISSRGRTLIIGSDLADILDCAEALDDRGMTCTLCLSAGKSRDMAVSRAGSFILLETDSVAISGSFGGFSLSASVEGEQMDLSALPGNEISYFDLVLDLEPETSYRGEFLPAGYYAPGATNLSLEEALNELPEMRGLFHKPQFVLFDINRCLHEPSSEHTCQRCLEICPVGAIRSENGRITVNRYHCQGCGACALTCPADALQMQRPDSDELLTEIYQHLSEAAGQDNTRSDLVMYDRNFSSACPDTLHSEKKRQVACEVDDIARIGTDIMLAAFAYGAGSVSVVCTPRQPARIRSILEKQVILGQMILEGLGIPADRLRFIAPADAGQHPDLFTDSPSDDPAEPLIPPAEPFPEGLDRRTLIRLAASYLFKFSPSDQPAVSLPDDAPFGTILINEEKCSLCMACVGACPAAALSAGGDTPRISFTESHCHQCGLCAEKCPENAITLLPRLLYDITRADQAEALREAEPFRCVECGLPFAAPAMIDSMIAKLNGHWMYSNSRQLRRLKMCRTCRTRDALTAGDYRS